MASETLKAATSAISSINLDRALSLVLTGHADLGSAARYEDEVFGIVDYIQIFEDLGREVVSQLCCKPKCFSAKRTDVIVSEGDDGEFLGITLTGEVEVVKRCADGVAKQLAGIGPWASVGQMSLIDGKPRFATCIAREPTDIAVLTSDTVYDILVLQPSLCNQVLLILLQVASQRLSETSDRLLPFIGGTTA